MRCVPPSHCIYDIVSTAVFAPFTLGSSPILVVMNVVLFVLLLENWCNMEAMDHFRDVRHCARLRHAFGLFEMRRGELKGLYALLSRTR